MKENTEMSILIYILFNICFILIFFRLYLSFCVCDMVIDIQCVYFTYLEQLLHTFNSEDITDKISNRLGSGLLAAGVN